MPVHTSYLRIIVCVCEYTYRDYWNCKIYVLVKFNQTKTNLTKQRRLQRGGGGRFGFFCVFLFKKKSSLVEYRRTNAIVLDYKTQLFELLLSTISVSLPLLIVKYALLRQHKKAPNTCDKLPYKNAT